VSEHELRTYERTITIKLETFDKDLRVDSWLRDIFHEEPWVARCTVKQSAAKPVKS
jgi:hypothetical protein